MTLNEGDSWQTTENNVMFRWPVFGSSEGAVCQPVSSSCNGDRPPPKVNLPLAYDSPTPGHFP
jgi:hypothetical protein